MATYFSEPSDAAYQLPYPTPPHVKWSLHKCPTQFLSAVARMHQKGTTELLFNVKQDGSVAGAVVAVSSLSADLDLLSAVCASKWRYAPAEENGAPIEVSWETQISWTQNGNRPKGDTPRIRLPATNCIRTRPGVAEHAPPAEQTAVRYQLLNGEVTAAAVEHSSGDVAVDEYATRCVQTWHFLPVTKNGNPATGAYVAVFYWKQML